MLTATFALFLSLLGLPLLLLDAAWTGRRASRMRDQARKQRAMLAFDRAGDELWDLVADEALPPVPRQFAVEILRGFRDTAFFVTLAPTLVTLNLMARVLGRYGVTDPRALRFLDLLNEGMQLLPAGSIYRRLHRHSLWYRGDEDDASGDSGDHASIDQQERREGAVAS